MKKSSSTLMASVLFLTACTMQSKMPELGTEEYRRMLVVAVQYCVPTTDNLQLLAASTVTRGSYGGGAIRRRDTTFSGQPVFEDLTNKRHTDLLATTVRLKDNDTEFVYFVPKDLPSTGIWTAWIPASTVVPLIDNARYRILYKMPLQQVSPQDKAPKVRYKIRPVAEEQVEIIDFRNPTLLTPHSC